MEDVVFKLYLNGLSDIVEEIFSYLDWCDIKNATEVSSTWRDVLMESEVNVWKNLWERSVNQVPAWILLYKRAVCQGVCKSQTHPDWNCKETCLIIGHALEKLLSNKQQGIYEEKRQEISVSESLCCEISNTKVCSTFGIFDKLRIQERWSLHDSPEEFEITGRPVQILHLEISEPYLVALTSDHSVCVWDLETNQKVHDFYQETIVNNFTLMMVHVKLNGGLLVTCACYGLNHSNNPLTSDVLNVLTARQLETNLFPIVDQIKIPNFVVESMFLEAERIVMFNGGWSQVMKVTIPPFQIICIDPIFPLINRKHFWKRMNKWATELKLLDKYWDGWLVQNESSDRISITNIDTAIAFKHPHDYKGRQLDFEIANRHIIVTYQENWNWKFDIWNLPPSNYSKEISLVYSFQQPHPHVYHESYYVRRNKWKVHFDDIQIWIFQCYDNWSLRDPHRELVIVRDFACCGLPSTDIWSQKAFL